MEIQNQKILSDGPEILLDYVNQCTNSVRLLREVIFAAGTDTSSTTVEWAMSEMIRQPKVLEKSFIPERFACSSIEFNGTHLEYIPFEAGRRMCPRVAFGLANIELPLAQLLYHFDWELQGRTRPEELDMTEKFGSVV
nr:cytochrome P450 71D8-like [Quercus suber]